MRRVELLDYFAACLDTEVRELLPDARSTRRSPPPASSAASNPCSTPASTRASDELEALLPSLMYFAVLPYEGHEAAAKHSRSTRSRRLTFDRHGRIFRVDLGATRKSPLT